MSRWLNWRIVPTALGAFVVAAVMLYLAVPRTIAAFIMLSGNETLEQIRARQPVRVSDLKDLIESRRAALPWTDSGRVWSDLALGQLLLAEQETDANGGPNLALVREALNSLENGLARAPLDPHAWTRLAYARYLVDGPSPELVSVLKMSIYAGPHEPRLVFLRLRLCLAAWDYFSEEERDLVYRQARFAWGISRRKLVDIADAADRPGVIRMALAQNPNQLAKFERMMRQQRAQSPEPSTESQ